MSPPHLKSASPTSAARTPCRQYLAARLQIDFQQVDCHLLGCVEQARHPEAYPLAEPRVLCRAVPEAQVPEAQVPAGVLWRAEDGSRHVLRCRPQPSGDRRRVRPNLTAAVRWSKDDRSDGLGSVARCLPVRRPCLPRLGCRAARSRTARFRATWAEGNCWVGVSGEGRRDRAGPLRRKGAATRVPIQYSVAGDHRDA